jgi:hypothetical protein
MHALDQVARATGEGQFNTWARELAATAYNAFSDAPVDRSGPRRMYWKMSIDLTRPQVSSMGQHDPLDGYVTNLELSATAAAFNLDENHPDLDTATAGYAAMLQHGRLQTGDPLGLGGLLVDAYRLHQLLRQDAVQDRTTATSLIEHLLEAALSGLRGYAQSGEYRMPGEYRLAFRELGLVIGLHAVARMQATLAGTELHRELNALANYLPLRDEIEAYWRDPSHQQSDNWQEHRNINEVMLATCLVPDGYLELPALH